MKFAEILIHMDGQDTQDKKAVQKILSILFIQVRNPWTNFPLRLQNGSSR